MSTKSQIIIGLTGGIATGKTTVSNYINKIYKIPILDADIYAREAVKANSSTLQEIFIRYGQLVQLPDGQLNRQILGDIIFNNSEERQWLESKIHPFIINKFKKEISLLKSSIMILSIPLLFEAQLTSLVTEIWVVHCSYEKQIKRLIKNNKMTKNQAIQRIESQMSLEEKIALANVVLDNSLTPDILYQQIDYYLKNKFFR
ncbi:dephospho-CoA kinase [cyanobacterium endosymbiont of Epithemia turgida]|uniref:dephospho-CoA kinase n=1 Tax=cyanobacterium endosymbiont of Epithemia turgida TaxID=718217 RepID=UPI0004D17023|nr:dephospho-CoA kinase [cyanobacterium endosymbiont of Epithemia turgida]BAP17749.1 putative dephospho-CoA kinase [cyanobacterium endosymbiont of Epithemia turgida isolate EtSB Lake Yunoko]